MEKRYYLAYGSNLNIEQMSYRCPEAVIAGSATLEDYRLLFRGRATGACLTIEKCKDAKVPLGVWLVSQEDERKLDRYEGYPHLYYKKDLDIVLENTGKKIHAFIYIMKKSMPLGCPTNSYIQTCAQGYNDFKFDIAILSKALDDSVKVSE